MLDPRLAIIPLKTGLPTGVGFELAMETILLFAQLFPETPPRLNESSESLSIDFLLRVPEVVPFAGVKVDTGMDINIPAAIVDVVDSLAVEFIEFDLDLDLVRVKATDEDLLGLRL
ncbi:unnamed protein product [Ambrosiozyma monospora]|uniref:Unnamed protein product n=1 Tax=Ambrosiozyma monospora TaxID=43982 RepID=A0ACB5T966_AMBMO|nr:unnamed protein product [Ambrosiozyma monospora]